MKLSVTIPILNEEDTLRELAARLRTVLEGVTPDWEVLFVDDGSTDRSWEVMADLHGDDERFGALRLSRNFGYQAACTAALDHARGDVVVLMDGDLQDPPELLPELLARLDEGYDVAYAVKRRRAESAARRLAFDWFYRLQRRLSTMPVVAGAGSFSAMSRRVVDCIRGMAESHRYVSLLRSFTGFRQVGVPFDRPGRQAGAPRQTLRKLVELALDGLFSFSYVPVRIATFLGLGTALVALVFAAIVLYTRLFTDKAIIGWASTMLSHLFLGAVQLVCLGILGEYIARIYDEVRRRPQYIIGERLASGPSASAEEQADG